MQRFQQQRYQQLKLYGDNITFKAKLIEAEGPTTLFKEMKATLEESSTESVVEGKAGTW